MTELDPPARPAGVLWDMDGTIVDTDPYWMRAELELVAEFDVPWTTEDSVEIVGSSLLGSAQIFQAKGVPLEAVEIVDRLNARMIELLEEGIPWRPGARELLHELHTEGIPTALVTMSYGPMAAIVAEALDVDVFSVVVTGDLVSEGKPHPEPYLRAARELGVAITDCVAIEDSFTGMRSAVASGAATIGVPLHHDLPESPDYTLWQSLAGKTIADLSAVLASRRGIAMNSADIDDVLAGDPR